MPQIDFDSKMSALTFLSRFHETLNAGLPPLDELRLGVRQTVAALKSDPAYQHTCLPERVFINTHVVKVLFNALLTIGKLTPADARQSLLCEGFTHHRDLSSGTPHRTVPHPFTKEIEVGADAVMERWKAGSLSKPDPDLATRSPFQSKILFEVKYFERGSAVRHLVSSIYEAFFYRSLPNVEPNRNGVGWDYDFACLLACDASPQKSLLNAWNELPEKVRDAFWHGANVYVMIVRPHSF